MENILFKIPGSKLELLDKSSNYFIVREVVAKKDILAKLSDAEVVMREQGAEGIIDTFSVYYSVLYHGKALQKDIIYKAYGDLHEAFIEVNRDLDFLLEAKDSLNDEVKLKFLNVLKMLTYVFTQIIILIEKMHKKIKERKPKSRRRSSTDRNFTIDKKKLLLTLMNLVDKEINLFWNPPVVENNFVGLISEVCYRFLQNPAVKSEKAIYDAIFNLIGVLIEKYGHGTNFIMRLVTLVRNCEHLIHCIPEGIKQLVQNFKCKSLVHELINELMKWQKYQDGQSARYCGSVLASMAIQMPDFMVPELTYLCNYLSYESPTLRNSVLTVMVEVVIHVLSCDDLTEEQKEIRDDLLCKLSNHTFDISAEVRSKVMQHWARLQKVAAIPVKIQNAVLKDIIECLHDKEAVVRKKAVNCVTTFLIHNPFGSNLSLSAMTEELENKKMLLFIIKDDFESAKVQYLEDMDAKWNSKKDALRSVIREELKKGDSEGQPIVAEENGENPILQEQTSENIRLYLNENEFKEAFELCRIAGKQIEELNTFSEQQDKVGNSNSDSEGEDNEVHLYLQVLHSAFLNLKNTNEALRRWSIEGSIHMAGKEYEKKNLKASVDLLENCVEFLTLIAGVFEPMMEMLQTANIGDMQEAVQFFISAYQFNLDNASIGIMAMLKLMKRKEHKCRDYIVNAFKTMYLTTNKWYTRDHSTLIVNRLIDLVKTLSIDNIENLELIISEWTAKGFLDDNVIDMLWQYFTKRVSVTFTKRVSVTDDDARAAGTLLKMCAVGRKTIISDNIELVFMTVFGECGENDMLLLEKSCELLTVAAEEAHIDGKHPPFKIRYYDDVFTTLLELLCRKFFEPDEFYSHVLFVGLTFIYKMCSKPDKLCEAFLNMVSNKIKSISQQSDYNGPDKYIIAHICELLGFIALKHLEYIDVTVCNELKRRNIVREEREQAKNKKSLAKRTSPMANNSRINTSLDEEFVLEETQSGDIDDEFIRNVKENDTLIGSGSLDELFFIIKMVCELPKVYDDVMAQSAAVLALMRYMLVSSKLCAQNIHLLFTILEKSEYENVKCIILLHLPELLARYPNIIEPWVPRLHSRLQDPSVAVRKASFRTFSKLILTDTIKVQFKIHLSSMACCLVDEDKEVICTCKSFFIDFSKEDDLYNALPDMFSHLMKAKDVTDGNVHYIMQFLFGLMRAEHMENLVDRFCCKFRLSEDIRHHRHISYCLALIQYNEKALKKLISNVPLYKHLLHDIEICDSFNSIMHSCNKINLGADVSELEKLMGCVLESEWAAC